MTEFDLLAAIGDVDERFIRLADGGAAQEGVKTEETAGAADEKKSLWLTIRERLSVRVIAGVFAAVIVLTVCGTLAYRALRKAPSGEGMTIDQTPASTASPTPESGTVILTEPLLVDSEVGTPYAILSDLKPTEESLTLEYGIEYVKVECIEQYAYQAKYGKITVIYVPSDLAAEISGYDMVMIRVETVEIFGDDGDIRVFLPGSDVRGGAEYLPFVGGKIRIDTLDSYSFGAIQVMNDYLQVYADTLARGGKVREKDKYLPAGKLSDGMTLQEVIDYFDAFDRWSNAN